MLLLDGQVHHDTHVIPVGNYVIGVGNYVIATPSELGNYLSADTGMLPREQGPCCGCDEQRPAAVRADARIPGELV